MIGGSGEKKTLRLVAQYADESNLTSLRDEIPRKLDVLAGHCERLGRDRGEITVSQQLNVCIAESHETRTRTWSGSSAPAARLVDDGPGHARPDPRAGGVGQPDEVGRRCPEVLASGVDGSHARFRRTASVAGGSALARETQPRCSAESPHRDRVNVRTATNVRRRRRRRRPSG